MESGVGVSVSVGVGANLARDHPRQNCSIKGHLDWANNYYTIIF